MVNYPSKFNKHRKGESNPEAINIPCRKKTNRWCWQLGHKNLKNYCELVTSNFELKFLLNFLDIWKKVIQKEPSDLDKSKKKKKIHTSWQKNQYSGKNVKEKCACCFGSKCVL